MGERVHECFARTIGNQSWCVFAVGFAGGDENQPAFVDRFGQVRRTVLGQPEQRLNIAANDVIEGVIGHFGDQSVTGIGGAMHHDIQATKIGYATLHHRLDRLAVGDVATDQAGFTAQGLDLLDCFFAVSSGACRHHHFGALAGIGQGNGASHASTGTGDQHDFVAKFHRDSSLLLLVEAFDAARAPGS
ncbi:hypothetical protein D3C84_714450 [compost metagenome]